MHDEVLTMFDDCIASLVSLRGDLAASRRVHPGERRDTLMLAIAVADHFARSAAQALADAAPQEPRFPAPLRPAAQSALRAAAESSG